MWNNYLTIKNYIVQYKLQYSEHNRKSGNFFVQAKYEIPLILETLHLKKCFCLLLLNYVISYC